jgi:ADP-heptose:LPS heptosyltransferase
MNILVIKLGALGDFIYALGPMAAIRRAHAGDHITLLTTKPFARLGKECGYFDDVWIDEKPKAFDILGWFHLRSRLNHGKFSRVYDLQNNDRTSLYFRLFSPRPEWVGAAKGASHRNDKPERVVGHAFHGHVQTLALAGITDVGLDPLTWMRCEVSVFGLPKSYVLLVAGSSPQHPEKRWPIEYYRLLAAKLLRQGYHPVLIGSKAEEETNAEISRGLDILNLTGKTALEDLPALARGAEAAIGNDTGPMHIICVSGCPTVMFFCSQKSTIQKHGPQGPCVIALEARELQEITPQDAIAAFFKVREKKG